MNRRFLLSIIIILASYTVHYAQAPTNVGWSAPGTAILSYSNSCGQFTNFTCLGSGTGSETPFIPGINYTIINDINNPSGCPNPLANAWIQIWDGDMSTCNSATPIGTPALNDLNVTMTGTGPYFLTVSSMNPTAADNLCGGGKGHDFTGQSATIRYRQETSVINTTSTDSICMQEGKDLTYQLVGAHDNPEVEWEIVSGNGNIVGSTFFATDTVEVTLRVKVGTCYDDITYKPVGSSTAPTAINGPQELCANTPFTLEAVGGIEIPGYTQYQWGKGNIVGQNPIAITPTPIYTPDLINQDETYWVRRINNTPGCNGYTLGVTIDILVNPIAETTLNETICEYETFSFGGQVLSSAGTYTDTLQTTLGCDSIVTLVLEVNPVEETTLNESICVGQTFSFGGQVLSTSGTYTDTLQTVLGCDSIVTLVLNVNPIAETTLNETICEYETFSFGGQALSSAGTYVDTLQTALGCDSIVTLNLTVDPYITHTLTETICQGESYVFNGVTYTSPVTLQDNITDTFATAGCDSIVTLVLNVNPIAETTLNETICEYETFSFGGQVLSTAGTYIDTLQTFLGCDSIVTLNLTVDPYITHTLTEAICQGESYVFNGVTYTSPVTLQDNITDTFATAGCDSIVTLVLNVNPIAETTLNETICEYETFSFGGQVLSTAGTYVDTFQTTLGCDSIVTLNLTVDPYITHTLTETICDGDSYVFNGVAYTSPVTLQDNITDTFATSGCDSIVTLVLNVNPTYYEDEVVTLCVSELPYVWNGINIPVGTTTQNAFDSLTYVTTAGCDSIIYLNLEIHDTFQIHETISICELDLPFTWHQHTFDTQTGLGTFTETASYQSVQGCDSTYYLTLHIQENFYSTVDTTICKESLPFVWHGYAFNDEASVAITPEITYYASSGCDSIVTLQVNLFDDVVITHVSEEACGAVTFEGNTYHQSVSFIDTSYNQAGCDSLIRHVDIVVHPSYTDYEVINLSSCDSVVYHDKTYYSSTQLVEEYTTAMGCDSLVVEVNIDIDHFNLELSASLDTLYKGESVYLETYGSSAYTVLSWTPTSYFPYQNATSQYLTLGESALIEVAAEGVGGCMDTASIYIHYQEINKDVFVPNAFTPDGDGLNDFFGPELPAGRGYEIEDFSIYNRYGERIFFNSGKENKKWDGTLRGQPVDVGVYFYVLVVRFIDGETFEAKGEVHLLR